jgi:tRNA(fMet)-specific endonuclease VapC
MPRYLLDTNICIYIAKRKPEEVLRRFEALDVGDVAMSLITYGELRFGAERSSQAARSMEVIGRLIEAVPVLPMSAMVAEHYGSIRAMLANVGAMIGNNDLWIAAHARAGSLTLVTNNESEFLRVPGLQVENWVTAP